RGRVRSRGRSQERNRHGDETAGRFRRRLSLRGSKSDRSRSDVGRGGPVAGTGARVLGNEPSQLSPESTSYQPPRDVLGAVWSQGRGSLSGGKRQKTRCIGGDDVSRTGEENAARRGQELRRACLWGLAPEMAEAVKTVEKPA